jgi:hypothetical protein
MQVSKAVKLQGSSKYTYAVSIEEVGVASVNVGGLHVD